MRIIRNTIYAAFAAMVCSCGFLDVEPSIMQKDNLYQSENDVKSGLAGVYGAINNEAFYGNNYSIMTANTDDLCYFNRTSTTEYLPIYLFDASNARIYDMWTEIYKGIRNANAFLDSMDESILTFAPKYANEARFLRAYYHFILAQTWGNVPVRTQDTQALSPLETQLAATPQLEVLKWVVSEMEACIAELPEELTNAPSRVVKDTAKGILARVYLFMAGKSVEGGDKKEYLKAAMTFAKEVIDGGRHRLNPDYSNVFKNMIADVYDREYNESMWEADFKGDRSSSDNWSNGRIGDVLGLQSSGVKDFSTFNCNFAYGQYNGSLKLWDLYWAEDRTEDEEKLENPNDARQLWNLPPYNYAGNANRKPYDWVDGDPRTKSNASIDKTPYVYGDEKSGLEGEGDTRLVPTAAQATRNAGKFRREVEYEGVKTAKLLYNQINFPILRYSDVLLMYAEAYNEYNGRPSEEAFNCVLAVRDRAGVKTREYGGNYDNYAAFQSLVRNERARELCFEGLRKFDLIRWGIFKEEMNNMKYWAADSRWSKNATISALASSIGSSVQEKHALLPIPSTELSVNKLLKQNPLW